MKFNTAVCGLALTLFKVAQGNAECKNALNSAFDKLAKQVNSPSEVIKGDVPAECQAEAIALDDSSLVSQPRTDYNTFCSFYVDGIDTTVATYSYDNNLSTEDVDMLPLTLSVIETFSNTSNANNCGSNLYYQADGDTGEGWSVWAESLDSASDTCTPPADGPLFTNVFASLYTLYVQRKTSYCVVYRDSSSWRGVVRALYSSETKYASPADIPCYTVNPGFNLVDNCSSASSLL